MNENIEKVLAALDGFRMSDEMTYSAYSVLYDEISLLDDLLKAQEPRVMTLDEVLAHDYKDGPLWLETIDNVITCGFAYCYKYYVQFSIPVMENEYLLKRDTWNRTDTYNKIWRCWTSRPTDEQREATPWES